MRAADGGDAASDANLTAVDPFGAKDRSRQLHVTGAKQTKDADSFAGISISVRASL